MVTYTNVGIRAGTYHLLKRDRKANKIRQGQMAEYNQELLPVENYYITQPHSNEYAGNTCNHRLGCGVYVSSRVLMCTR